MKRAFAAAVLSGLFVFAAPQVVLADHAADHAGDCGVKSEKSQRSEKSEKSADPEEKPPSGRPYGDREQHDDDDHIF